MATITSAQSGNWSDPATWVGGVVPTVDDDVVIGSHTVTADVDISVRSVLRTSGSGHVLASTSRTIICSGNGIRTQGSGGAGVIRVTAGFSEIVNIFSDMSFSAGASGGCQVVNITGSATTNIIGNIDATLGSFNSQVVDITASNAIVNVTGQVTWGSNFSQAIRITGVNSTLNVNGLVLAGATHPTIVSTVSSVINVIGVISATAGASAISSSSIVRVGGSVFNSGSRIAILSSFINVFSSIETVWEFGTEDALIPKPLYTAGLLTGYPPENKVEDSYTYGPSGEFTGNLVPVNVDVQQLASDLLTEMETSNLPIALRMRNTATDAFVTSAVAAITPAP